MDDNNMTFSAMTLKLLRSLVSVFRYLKNVVVGIIRFLVSLPRRFWTSILRHKIAYAIALLVVVFGIGIIYFNEEILPEMQRESREKLINERISEIEHELKYDSIEKRLECAYNIIDKEHKWYYINETNVYKELEAYRITDDLKQEAISLIEAAAFAGEPRWQYILAQFYYLGSYKFYCNQDLEKSVYWFNQAALQGYEAAYNNLGILYLNGGGVTKDLRKAVYWLKKGAQADDPVAQSNYGDMFVDGVVVNNGKRKEIRTTSESYTGPEDHIISVERGWKENTVTPILTMITTYYIEVDDSITLVPKDIKQARYWWTKAAEQGNKAAKDKLQKIYESE